MHTQNVYYANAIFIRRFLMFNFEDYSKNFEKIMAQSPIKLDEAMKSLMDYNTKVGKIALDTVKKNADLSQVWAKESLTALDPFVKSPEKPEDFMKMATDYVSSQAQSAPKHMAEFAEVAKKAQLETIDLICLLYTSPSPRDISGSRMPSYA